MTAMARQLQTLIDRLASLPRHQSSHCVVRGQQVVEVERIVHHCEGSVRIPRPLGSRPVAIYLDQIPVRIVEIDGLADAVVGLVHKSNTVCQDALDGASKALPVGINKGDMVQSSMPVGRRQTAEALSELSPT